MSLSKHQIETIAASGLFDPDWYARRYPDVGRLGMDPFAHFVAFGAALRRSPGPDFDSRAYLAANPDVARAGIDPLYHYIAHGAAEGRSARGQVSAARPGWRPEAAAARRDGPVVFLAGEPVTKPGHTYRVTRAAEAFARAGVPVRTFALDALEGTKGAAALAAEIARARLLVIWRAAWGDAVAAVIARARAAGVPVAFDLDDLMVRPELATPEIIDALRFEAKDPAAVAGHYARVRRTLRACDIATATTAELAWHIRRAGGRRRATFVLPNGFDEATYARSRLAARARAGGGDGLLRIGYAGGTRTHQADFRVCAAAVAGLLRARAEARLVLFSRDGRPTLEVGEFPELAPLAGQIEWRAFVPHAELPDEIGRFDINLAPLQTGNPFCEAKSELKFFEAAIADVPTVASPTGPFARAIVHGESGMLAATPAEWAAALEALAADPALRRRMGREAHRRVLWPFGPLRRVEAARSLLDALEGGRARARAFRHEIAAAAGPARAVPLVPHEVVFAAARPRASRVSVIVPLYNYGHFVEEALESVKAQSLEDLDLVVVDDASTDDSGAVARRWLEANRARFNRVLLVRHTQNAGLGAARNTAFDLADSLYVMALDADNRLRPDCCARLLDAITAEAAAFAYPVIQQFGEGSALMGNRPYDPACFVPGNGVDAMAMIAKEAWARVGGYATHRLGWQDYDFWCRLVEEGLIGVHVPAVLADYRVHGGSMLRTRTDGARNKAELAAWMEAAHPWLSLAGAEREGHRVPAAPPAETEPETEPETGPEAGRAAPPPAPTGAPGPAPVAAEAATGAPHG